MRIVIVFFIILWMLCSTNGFAGQLKYQTPDDPNAITASESAVSALGPQRGAIVIKSSQHDIIAKSLELVGLSHATDGSGLSLKADIRGAEKVLRDLGAKKSDIGYELSLSGDVLFDFNKWNIKPEAEATLSKLADALKKLGDKQIAIEGHTDSVGSDSYNLDLSEKRAQSVRTWLIQKGGVATEKISARGLGESKPIAPNTLPDGSDNPEGRAKNRRVEIHIQ